MVLVTLVFVAAPAASQSQVALIVVQPTNDLDLATIESMESFLAGYGGCLLVASHDRSFMEGLDRLFVLRGDGVVRLFEGSYSEVTSCPLYVAICHCCNQELPSFS